MFKAFKYRLYPTEKQIVLINKHIGASRFIYNLAFETKQMAYVGSKMNLSCFDLMKQLTDLKKECEWLKEINSQSLQQAITNLDKAYTAFFKGQNSSPKFKKKSNRGSYNIPQNIILKNGKLFISKFREGIKIVLDRPTEGLIKQATISKTPTGKYFVSILCETEEVIKQKSEVRENTTIGIDLGIKSLIVSSDGKEFENQKFLKKNLSKLKFLQRKYSKYKGKRIRYKLSKLHEKITNQRKDYLHKVSIQLIRENQSIAIENLQVNNMIKNHNLAQSIQDVSWSMFTGFLKYKAEWYGKNILEIGTFEPSSKTCSNCGWMNRELKLQDREWTCKNCGKNHDRDINAAINIKNFALRNHVSGRDTKTQNELPTLVGVLTSEIH